MAKQLCGENGSLSENNQAAEDTENCNKPLVETVITDVEISADDLTPNNENEAENGVCKHGNPSENDVSESREKVLYKLEDIPPWYLTLLFGFQHLMVTMLNDLAQCVIIAGAVCTAGHDNVTAEIFGIVLFISGLATLAQSTIGCRLPIVQGVSGAFTVQAVNYLSQPEWKCPEVNLRDKTNNYTYESINESAGNQYNLTNISEPWVPRMQELQGAVVIGGLFELFLGSSGVLGATKRWLGPLTIGPVIIAIALAMLKMIVIKCSMLWWISLMTAGLAIFFSQHLGNIPVPLWFFSIKNYKVIIVKKKVAFFRLFAIGLALIITWVFCAILTATDVLPNDPELWGYAGRTDVSQGISFGSVDWVSFPRPLPWGSPRYNIALILSILSVAFVSTIDSVGDYHACASVAEAPSPPYHAVNRGITVEGIACMVGAFWGCANGTSSHGSNIAALGISKVASRRVVQVCGCILLILSFLPKFSAACVLIPEPVVGGILLLTFSTIAGVGISCLRQTDLKASRTCITIGFSLFIGMALSQFIKGNTDSIDTGSETADQILRVLVGNSMLVTGVVAFVLDNTIPGTLEQRGLPKKNTNKVITKEHDPYQIPGMAKLRTMFPFLQRLPICPTYRHDIDKDKKDNKLLGSTA